MSKLNLSDAARLARNTYCRNWKRKNPDKVKQYNENFWERKAAAIPIEQRAFDLYQKGLSYREIGTELNINHMKVSRMVKAVTDRS